MKTLPQETEQVLAAETPHDLFGDTDKEGARRRYRELARVLHPDRGGDTEAFQKLGALWERFKTEFRLGTYGTADASIHGLKLSSRTHTYTLDRRLANGELADLFTVTDETNASCVVKLVRRSTNNMLLVREMQVLREIRGQVEPTYLPYFPDVKDSFAVKEGSVIRRANVFNRLTGFHTLAQVKEAFPHGIDPRDGAWMWRRLLTVLGATHQAGVVHGAVLPQHVLILGEQRGMVLVGWCAAQQNNEPISLVSNTQRWWYPQEVWKKQPSRPETDIFMASRIIEGLVGSRLPKQMRAHFKACQLPSAAMRPDDAWALKDTFDDLNERLFGKRRFKPFVIPTGRE